MAIALTATGYWIYIDQAFTPDAVVACVIIYNAAFGMSWGPIPWLYPPEIMPLPFRAKGVSISTATNWLAVSRIPPPWAALIRAELLGRRIDACLSGVDRLAAVPDARVLLCPVFRAR